MTTPSITELNLESGARLEHVLDLPLGTVVADKDGVDHVYFGMRPNTAGHELLFVPHAGSRFTMMASYALVDGGLRKFPGLAGYLRGRAPATEVQTVKQINAILEPETGFRVEEAESPGGPFLRLLRRTGLTWDASETIGVFPREIGSGSLTCVGPVARHFYKLGQSNPTPADDLVAPLLSEDAEPGRWVNPLRRLNRTLEADYGVHVQRGLKGKKPVLQLMRRGGPGEQPWEFVANFAVETSAEAFISIAQVAKTFTAQRPSPRDSRPAAKKRRR